MVSTTMLQPIQAAAAIPGTSVERAAAYMAQLEARHAAAAAAARGDSPGPPQVVSSYDARHPGGNRLSTQTKNRRWAKMQQLEGGGEFFSESAMRQRAPGLWHEHIGRYEGGPPVSPEPTAAGESWAHSLLRAHDAAQAQLRLEAEQAKDEAQMSEEESDEEDGKGAGGVGGRDDGRPRDAGVGAPGQSDNKQQLRAAAAGSGGAADDDEMQEAAAAPGNGDGMPVTDSYSQRRHDFLNDMRARFLCGEDSEYVSYAAIDADASLDDEEHLRREQDQDAEDAYFDGIGMDDME